MNIGIAVTIYLLIFCIISLLLYVVTRYYNYRLNKSIQNSESYQLIQGIRAEKEQITDTQYQQFVQKHIPSNKKNPKKLTLNQEVFQEIKSIKNSFNRNRDTIYEPPTIFTPTHQRRSTFSIRPDRLATPVSDEYSGTSFLINAKNIDIINSQNIQHKFFTQMVAYNQEGILVIENDVQQLIKNSEKGKIQEIGNRREQKIQITDKNFYKALQLYGFEKGQYGAYRYTVTAYIPNMKIGKLYPIQILKTRSQKQCIQFQSFYHEYGHYSENKKLQ